MKINGFTSLLSIFLLSHVVFLSACAPSGIAVVSVKGTVLRQGAPVDDALVMFVPVSEGRSTAGKTDFKGEFVMITPGARKSGCVPGKYNVLVTKTVLVDSKGRRPEKSKSTEDSGETGPLYDEKAVLPAKYGNAETSGLEVDVKKRGTNHFVFNLDDK